MSDEMLRLYNHHSELSIDTAEHLSEFKLSIDTGEHLSEFKCFQCNIIITNQCFRKEKHCSRKV